VRISRGGLGPARSQDQDGGLDFNSALPLYYQLKELIKSGIARHHWKLGEMIPSENELAAGHGVSVGTVKKALSELVQEGILHRRQGKGTFVARPNFQRSFIRFFRYGLGQAREDVIPASRVLRSETIVPPGRVREILRLDEADQVLVIKRLRLFDQMPLMLEELYLPEKIFRGFDQVDISQALLYPIYDAKYQTPITWADEFLEPRIAGPEVAAALDLEPGAPVIFIERIAYTHGDRPVEFRSSFGRGDRFRYHIEIR